MRGSPPGDWRPRTARVVAATIALLGALAVWLVATRVFPYHSLNHDEAVYLQQAAMLLEGQLNLYPQIEDVFRPWFFVDAGDRLYPKYTPVPAGMFALGLLVDTPRLALAGIGGGILALTYAVTTEVFDRRTGLLAAAFVLASPLFLINTAVFLPYAPTAMLNLAFAWAYLRGDRTGGVRWAAVAGIAVGLAFFARSYTAVLFAAPFVAHACYTLWSDRAAIRTHRVTPALARLSVIAALGLGGVVLTLGYNAAMTGAPTRFPYEAFGPRDGLGFGTRRLLAHEVQYTPELALRANAQVVRGLATDWIAGGVLGAILAALGVTTVVRRGITARQAVLAGLFLSVIAGNVYFWGNFNILGNLSRAEDGLIGAMGPHYHYDLLLPTAAFAAHGAIQSGIWLRTVAGDRLAGAVLDPRLTRAAVAVLLLVAAVSVGVTSATLLADPIDDNAERTAVYERAYEPFEDGPPVNAVVFLPTPYGDWLNHPFQTLRNAPGYDGDTLYALDERPFAVADAFPDRRLYRYAYRGHWAPSGGSPRAATLQRVRAVRGEQVALDATLGVPQGAESVTVRLGTDDGSAYYVADDSGGSVSLRLGVTDETVSLAGDARPLGNVTLGQSDDDTVRLTAFVDYGTGGGFSYRLDLPTRTEDGRVRALSPRIERCQDARACGGAATYVPETAPEGVFVRTSLSAGNRS